MARATVLVVDDEWLIRWSIRERLLLDGYDILEAGTGAEARAAMALSMPDLVLLDMRLPDVDGLALLREIKARDPEMSVIVMTAFLTLENAGEAMRLGVCHCLGKPFDVDELALRAGRVLERVGPSRSAAEIFPAAGNSQPL